MDNTGKEIIDVGKALLKDIFSQNWMEISIVCIVVLIFILITLFSIILLLISIVERNFRDITKNIVLSLYSVCNRSMLDFKGIFYGCIRYCYLCSIISYNYYLQY